MYAPMIHPIPIGTEPNIHARYISPTLLPTITNTIIIKQNVKIDNTPVINETNLIGVIPYPSNSFGLNQDT